MDRESARGEHTASQVLEVGEFVAPICVQSRGQLASWFVHQVFLVDMGTELGSIDWEAAREKKARRPATVKKSIAVFFMKEI